MGSDRDTIPTALTEQGWTRRNPSLLERAVQLDGAAQKAERQYMGEHHSATLETLDFVRREAMLRLLKLWRDGHD